MAALGLDGPKQRALLRLRGKLTLRQFMRERGRLVGLVLALLFALPLLVGAAVASFFGYLRLPQPWPAQLLGIVLVGLWLAWITLPIFAFNLNEGMDITRLLVYPLSRRDLVVAMLLGTLFDYPTYLMLPLFLAILAGWGLSSALPVVILALLLSYGHMVLASQLILSITGGILSSRRFRDLFVVLMALFGTSCYLLQQGAIRLFSSLVEPEQLQALRPLLALQWLPPGAAARAIERATAGLWGEALLWLLYASVLLVLLAWLWWRLSLRLITGEGFLLSLPAGRREQKGTRAAGPVRFRWLPADLRQLAAKELKILWRTPQRRVGLLQGLLFPLIMGGFTLFSGGGLQEVPPWTGLTLPFYAVFSFWITTQNMLGWEGEGLPTLILTPVSRQRVFLAKGLVLGGLSFLPLLLLGGGFFFLARSWMPVAGLLAALAAGLLTLAVTTVSSVYFPFAVQLEGTRVRRSGGGGCLAGVMNSLGIPVAVGVLLLPVAAFLGLALWLQQPLLGLVAAFLSIPYAALLYGLAIRWAGRLLLQREAEVVEATRPPD